MAASNPDATGSAPIAKLRLILDSFRFEHIIFALPFAYLGLSANRITDRRLDARNPQRHLRLRDSLHLNAWL